MPLNDMLLQIDSYPEASPMSAIDQAVAFASALGASLSALAVEVDIREQSNWLADYLIGLSQMAKEEERKSHDACKAALTAFAEKAAAAGVLNQALHGRADLYLLADYVAEQARTRDTCLVPMGDLLDGQRAVAEAVLFGSGRPLLLFRPGKRGLPTTAAGSILLAWDGSRAAARAMADALPLLMRAREVRVLTILNEKASARPGQGVDAGRHLQLHGVNAIVEDVDAAGRRIGPAIDAYAAEHGCNMLVMGAYGRSRIREFILGGATEYMLHDPDLPVFMSH